MIRVDQAANLGNSVPKVGALRQEPDQHRVGIPVSLRMATIGLKHDLVLLLQAQGLVVNCPTVLLVGNRHQTVAVRTESRRRRRIISFGIDNGVSWPRIRWAGPNV